MSTFDTGFLVLLFHFLFRNFFQKFPGIIFPFSEFYGIVQFGLFHAYTSDRVDSWITKNQIQISLVIFRYITILPVANKLMLNRYFFRMLQIEWIKLSPVQCGKIEVRKTFCYYFFCYFFEALSCPYGFSPFFIFWNHIIILPFQFRNYKSLLLFFILHFYYILITPLFYLHLLLL